MHGRRRGRFRATVPLPPNACSHSAARIVLPLYALLRSWPPVPAEHRGADARRAVHTWWRCTRAGGIGGAWPRCRRQCDVPRFARTIDLRPTFPRRPPLPGGAALAPGCMCVPQSPPAALGTAGLVGAASTRGRRRQAGGRHKCPFRHRRGTHSRLLRLHESCNTRFTLPALPQTSRDAAGPDQIHQRRRRRAPPALACSEGAREGAGSSAPRGARVQGHPRDAAARRRPPPLRDLCTSAPPLPAALHVCTPPASHLPATYRLRPQCGLSCWRASPACCAAQRRHGPRRSPRGATLPWRLRALLCS